MKTQDVSHLIRVFFIFAAIQIVFDLVFVIFGVAGESNALLLPPFWDLATFPLWLLVILTLYFKRKESFRQEELANISIEKKQKLESSQLFGQDYEDVLLQRQNRFLKRTLSPILVVLSLLSLVGISIAISMQMFGVVDEKVVTPLQGSLFLFRACISYILAIYLLGLSVPISEGSLATLGGLGLYHTFQCVVLGGMAFVDPNAMPNVHQALEWLLIAAVSLYAIEVMVRSVTQLYSVEKSPYPPQCSFLVTFRFREKVLAGTKQSFEYQFGYDLKSSVKEIFNQTGFYLTCLLLFSLAASSCVGTIETGQVGFVEVFGKKQEKALEPGLYFKYPWPIAVVRKVDTERVRRLSFGSKEREDMGGNWMGENHEDKTMYLTVDEKDESRDLPFEAYAINAVLHYKIKSAEKYLYGYGNTDTVIAQEAERLLIQELLEEKHIPQLLTHREVMVASLKQKLIERFESLGLGIEVTYFSIPVVHPPKKTAEAFEATIAAHQEKEQRQLEAHAKRAKLEAELRGLSAERIAKSKAQAAKIKSDIESDLLYLEMIKPIYRSYADVFLTRKTLETYSEATRTSRKYIILNTPSREIDILNLEDVEEDQILDQIIRTKDN